MSKAEGQVVARPETGRDVRGETRPLVTCCDPVLGTLNFGSMFGKDPMPGGNFGSNYGITFNPTPAFSAAMNNTSFIANVTGGVSPGVSWLLLVGELRTDNVPLGTPMLTTANLPALWSTFTTPLGGAQNLAIWDSPPANVLGTNWAVSNPFVYRYAGPVLGTTHMRADGTRYILKLSYVMVYQTAAGWVYRPIECNNAKVRYIGFTINYAATRASSGPSPAGSGALQVVTAEESRDQGGKSLDTVRSIPAPDALIKQLRR